MRCVSLSRYPLPTFLESLKRYKCKVNSTTSSYSRSAAAAAAATECNE